MRQQYLDALGIQTWLPRVVLPGAKLPPALNFILDEKAAPIAFDNKAAKIEVTAVGRMEHAVTDRGLAEPIADQGGHQFRLVSMLYPGHCMVISDFSAETDAHMTSAQHRLLSDMLLVLGVTDPESAKPVFFDWPMQNQQVDQSTAAALEAMQAFLNTQVDGQKLRFVLIMGETAGRYILPHEAELANAQGKLWSIMDYPALITDSIDHILAQPLCKRDVWRDIQPLCRLAANGT